MTHLDTHLSLRFNLALGLIPGLMAILLAFFIPHEQAIYIGTLIGVLASLYVWIRLNKEPKQVLLFSATLMLMLMSLSHSISFCHCPDSYQSLVIEIAVTLPAVLVIFIQKGLRTHRPTNAEKKHRYRITFETLMASSKIIFVLLIIQVFISLLCWLFAGTSNKRMNYWLFAILPGIVLLATIVINQLSLRYFNRMMRKVIVLPIVNTRGDVIGKCLSGDSRKKYIHPMIRISVIQNGMEWLHERSDRYSYDKGKQDVLIEGHLFFKESLEQGAYRMLRERFPHLPNDNLKFVSRYYMEYGGYKRLTYLFVLELAKEEKPLLPHELKTKPWTWKQIDDNMGKGVFSYYFEYEYNEHMKILSDSKLRNKERMRYLCKK